MQNKSETVNHINISKQYRTQTINKTNKINNLNAKNGHHANNTITCNN